MVNVDVFLQVLERHLPVLVHGWKKDLQMMVMPVDCNNIFGTDVKFRSADRELLLSFNEWDMKMDPNKVLSDVAIMLEDKFAPRIPRIATAAMPKNQVPTNNRTRIPNWRTPPCSDLLLQ